VRTSLVAILAAAILFAPAPAAAQFRMAPRPDLSDSTTRACVTALPASEFMQTVVSLGAGVPAGWGDSAAVESIFLLAQDVATRVREQLGAPSGIVPSMEAKLPWTAVWGRLNAELFSDGVVTIESRPPRDGVDSLAIAGDTLIERALRSLVADGDLWPFVPTEWALSWRFTLFFGAPDLTEENTRVRTVRAIGIPVFALALPKYAPLRWTREPTQAPDFYRWDRIGAFSDSVTFRFAFDEKGYVDKKSVREVPYRDDVEGLGILVDARFAREPGDAATRAKSRERFVTATARALEYSAWSAGRIGSCALPRVAHQTFTVLFARQP